MVLMNASPIKDFLASLPRNEPLVYFANPGNAGDAMIAHATFQLLRELGIHYSIADVSRPFDPAGRIMLYSGGGNLVPYYNTARKMILKYYPSLARLVILPHTIQANEDLLAGFGANVDVICREPVSYAHVRAHTPRARVHLMEDMAFLLDAKALLADSPFFSDLVPISWKLRDGLFEALLPLRAAFGSRRWGTINAFRKDLESAGHFPQRTRTSVDLAALFSHGTGSEAVARYVTHRLLRVLDHWRVVRTDRLHICIAAAMLGKKVEFFANSYSKCEDVFNYSIKDRFPNVHWMG
jgi:exopolysaccharide biosynthesis predicted pyruvyltransferase EpsI